MCLVASSSRSSGGAITITTTTFRYNATRSLFRTCDQEEEVKVVVKRIVLS